MLCVVRRNITRIGGLEEETKMSEKVSDRQFRSFHRVFSLVMVRGLNKMLLTYRELITRREI